MIRAILTVAEFLYFIEVLLYCSSLYSTTYLEVVEACPDSYERELELG